MERNAIWHTHIPVPLRIIYNNFPELFQTSKVVYDSETDDIPASLNCSLYSVYVQISE